VGSWLDPWIAGAADKDADDLRRCRLLAAGLAACLPVGCGLTVVRAASTGLSAATLLSAGVALTLVAGLLGLRLSGRRERVVHAALGVSSALFLALAIDEGGGSAPTLIWFPTVPILGVYFGTLRSSALYAVVLASACVLIAAVHHFGWRPADAPALASLRALETAGAILITALIAAGFEVGRRTAAASQARLIKALDHAADPVLILDAAGSLVYTNPAARAVDGLLDVARAWNGVDPSAQLSLGTPRGPRDYSIAFEAEPGGDRRVRAHDVTALRAVDRLKSEFVSTVSHELRTPLTSVRGALGLVT